MVYSILLKMPVFCSDTRELDYRCNLQTYIRHCGFQDYSYHFIEVNSWFWIGLDVFKCTEKWTVSREMGDKSFGRF